jgi:hypothetical protein
MSKKLFVMALAGLLLNLVCVFPVAASGGQEKEAKQLAEVKNKIAHLGTGPDARVEVKLRDKTKLKGYVSKIGDDDFTITDRKSGAATTVRYAQVEKLGPRPSVKDGLIDISTNRVVRNVSIGVSLAMLALLVVCVAGKCQE